MRCQDCGDLATWVYVDAYGPGKHMLVCKIDADYYASVGATVRKMGE